MKTPTRTNYLVVGLVFLIFFVISLITNILGPLTPEFIKGFSLSQAMAGFLPTSFFIAYGVMSIPAGMLIERFREKPVIVAAFALALIGSLTFALMPVYGVALTSFFVIGVGMAILQVAINPLLRVAGGEAHFAFFSVMAQLVFGGASFISPQIYSHLVTQLRGDPSARGSIVATLAPVVPAELPWVSLYWVFAAVSLAMVVVMFVVRLPKVERKDDERAGAWATHTALFRDRQVRLFALGIFCYVGCEQGIANWISQFLKTYHGLNPETDGASAVGAFWLLLTVGCVLGLLLLKLFDSRKVLIGAALLAIVTLGVALFSGVGVAKLAFPALGFCLSVMWSIVFSLGMNSVRSNHGSLSGILCTAIIGGAVVPPVIGWLGDRFGLRQGMMFLWLPLAYILSIGFWARPLVNNATLDLRRKDAAAG